MADTTFIQNSRIGRCIFQLCGDQLEVHGMSGGKIEKTFTLKLLHATYSRHSKQLLLLFLVPGFMVIVGAWLMILVLNQDLIPREVTMYPSLGVVFGVLGLVRATPKVEYFQFNDHWGRPAFFVVRERAQAQECDAFVKLLADEIERAQRGEEAVRAKAPPASSVFLPNPADSYFADGTRWQISVVLGSLAFAIPNLPKSNELLEGDLMLLVVFSCSFTSMVCSVLSYQARERLRHLSLFGAALSLLVLYS